MKDVRIAVALLIGLLLPCVVSAQQRGNPLPIYSWYGDYKNSNMVIVFVHGIFGNSNTFLYESNDGPASDVFWPDVLLKDPITKDASIFLGGYYTNPDSQDYAAAEAADDLLAALNRPNNDTKRAVLDHKNVIFVCHSTGGIVVRQMLAHNRDAFRDHNIGLVLIASPSIGSRWADRLSPIAKLAHNKLAQELEENNSFLMQLDVDFKKLLGSKTLNIEGIEAAENQFIVKGWFFDKVVEVDSAERYFPNGKMLAKTDHFSSVKPDSTRHPAHLLLTDFFAGHFTSRLDQYRLKPPTSAVVNIRTEVPSWMAVSAANAPVVTKVSMAVDASTCSSANEPCVLRLKAPSHNPFQLGDYRLDHIKHACHGPIAVCQRAMFHRVDKTVDGNVTDAELVVSFPLAAATPTLDGSAQMPAIVTVELGADMSTMAIDASNTISKLWQGAYGDVFDISLPQPGQRVSLDAQFLESSSRIAAGEDAATKGLALIQYSPVTNAYRYQVKRP